MLGTKTSEYLGTVVADAFKREVDADEAIWRSLPFFAAIIGLAIAILPPIYRSAFDTVGVGRIMAFVLLASALVGFGIAAYWFYAVIRLREYVYPPSPESLLAYANELDLFYAGQSIEGERRDEAVRDDIRAFTIGELARSTSNNRRLNNEKATARSLVLLFVMAGFLLAFVAEATILVSQALEAPTPTERGASDDRIQADRNGRGHDDR